MIRFLFPRLTPEPPRGAPLFQAVVEEARKPHWFRDGAVPDTLAGRFAVLATIIALATIRLERGGAAGEEAGVALAERFVEAMDAEHRQLGLGDPTLGKKVRELVASLARRIGLWRQSVDREDWRDATIGSLYSGSPPEPALTHSEHALRRLWAKFLSTSESAMAEGRFE